VKTITQFLEERLAEREERYKVGEFENVDSVRGPDWGVRTCPICHEHGWEGSPDVTEEAAYKHLQDEHDVDFVLAEIAAMRRIIEITRFSDHEEGDLTCVDFWLDDERKHLTPPPVHAVLIAVTVALVQIWADHPDFQEDWRS